MSGNRWENVSATIWDDARRKSGAEKSWLRTIQFQGRSNLPSMLETSLSVGLTYLTLLIVVVEILQKLNRDYFNFPMLAKSPLYFRSPSSERVVSARLRAIHPGVQDPAMFNGFIKVRHCRVLPFPRPIQSKSRRPAREKDERVGRVSVTRSVREDLIPKRARVSANHLFRG